MRTSVGPNNDDGRGRGKDRRHLEVRLDVGDQLAVLHRLSHTTPHRTTVTHLGTPCEAKAPRRTFWMSKKTEITDPSVMNKELGT